MYKIVVWYYSRNTVYNNINYTEHLNPHLLLNYIVIYGTEFWVLISSPEFLLVGKLDSLPDCLCKTSSLPREPEWICLLFSPDLSLTDPFSSHGSVLPDPYFSHWSILPNPYSSVPDVYMTGDAHMCHDIWANTVTTFLPTQRQTAIQTHTRTSKERGRYQLKLVWGPSHWGQRNKETSDF